MGKNSHTDPDELGWVTCHDPQRTPEHPDNCVHNSHAAYAAVVSGQSYADWRAERDAEAAARHAYRVRDAVATVGRVLGGYTLSVEPADQATTLHHQTGGTPHPAGTWPAGTTPSLADLVAAATDHDQACPQTT